MVRDEERLRGRRLQTVRTLWFNEHPLCVHCQAKGITKPAEELDHILPISKGGGNEAENLQGLCKECHEAKTILDLGYKDRPEIGLDGFPIERR
jgi:5-methylcytosine-specific restriction protein A